MNLQLAITVGPVVGVIGMGLLGILLSLATRRCGTPPLLDRPASVPAAGETPGPAQRRDEATHLAV